MAFKAAVCPSCAGELQVPDNRDLVKCMYCGSDIIVREVLRTGSTVNIENILKLARVAEKSNNYIEAYKYFSQVLEHETQNAEAWFGRGTAVGRQSTIDDLRLKEMISCYENAMQYASENERKKLMEDAANTINEIAVNCWNKAIALEPEDHKDYATWIEEYYNGVTIVVRESLTAALEFAPENTLILKNIICISTDVLGRAPRSATKDLQKMIDDFVRRLKLLESDYSPPKARKFWTRMMGFMINEMAK